MDKAKLWTNEGQPNNIQAFFSKSRFIRNPRSWLPRRGSCRLLPTEEVFACLPLTCIKFCSQNFLRQKLSATSCFPLSSTLSPSKAFPPLLFLRCYIPAFVAPALPVRFNPRFSSYPLFSKTISPRNPFAPDRCFRRKHNYYLITFPKTPFIVPRFFILNANICSFFYSITYKTCQHIAIFRKFFHFFYRLF